ncbi:prolyl oligopeptidase family serine peptidase [Alkaliphilus serpentinus]|uniref:prolyl oligopeptidase n=1 Tax=Alkaliphilus serpentinus TaxID=1482731 RepID=A0A833HLH2_9FIRM|nr:prolyl oligopeptidase family serine peptidase [Alkaliphilus serpentinus]KAB3525895.1 S9 family peptidase [Alkaliphilus serpentinus]
MFVTKKDSIVEDYHGVKVSDPYRWLEDADSLETRAWSDYQNQLSHEYFNRIPSRDKYRNRLTKLWNYSKYFTPQKVKNRTFFLKNDGLQNQEILYMQTHDEKPMVLIDPNTFSDDGTIALTNYSISKEGNLLAYATSKSGSDWQQIRLKDINTNKELKDLIKWCKFTNIAWAPNDSGFYYSRFPETGTVDPGEESYYNSIYFHKVGTPQEMDPIVYQDRIHKELSHSPSVTEDGEYILIHARNGTSSNNRFYYRAIDSNDDFIRLIDEEEAQFTFIHNKGPIFYFKTDLDAPRGRVIAIDIHNPDRNNWKKIIPQSNDTIDSIQWINNSFVVVYLYNALHQVKVFNLDGSFLYNIDLPIIGSITEIKGDGESTEMSLGITSYLFPTSIYRFDFNNRQLYLVSKPHMDFDSSQYQTTQVFFNSKDGTRVPMFLTHKRGIELDGNNQTLLFGYGGFKISLTPSFNPAILPLLEDGGIFAVANLRGGNEYGEEWHQGGMLDKKQNVFDDFISAAEFLIENNYTKRSKLSIMGRSNGGLLVATCMVQRPDLYGAVICNVPVIDMLRYHRFTIGRYWIGEYGNAEANADHFKFMYAYSPLHNVQEGENFPPILIATADTDDRVVPAHAKKFAATLKEKSKGDSPILLRIEKDAGHGLGKPISKLIDEWADFLAFLSKELMV